LTIPTLGLTERIRLDGLGRVTAAGLGALALAAFWVLPYLAHFALRGPVPAWATPPIGPRLADIVAGRILFARGFALLVILGLIFGVTRVVANRRWAAALIATPGLFLVLAHFLASHYPHLELSPQLANRGLGYVGLVALMPLAAALAFATKRFGRSGDLAAAAAAILVVVGAGGLRGRASQMPAPAPELAAAARAIHELVPPSARFATQRDFPGEIERLGPSHPDFWLARQSGRNTLNVFGLELSTSPSVAGIPEAIGHTTAIDSAHALSRLGVTHAVTVNDAGRVLLEASPRFALEWSRGSLAIFRVLPDEGQPPPAALVTTPDGPLEGRVISARPDHLRIAVDASTASTLNVAVARSPKWHLSVNGRAQPAGHSPEGMLTASVGPGRSVLDLAFRPDRWDGAGVVVSALSGLGLLLWCGRRLVARRRQPSSRMSSSFSRTA
ncbi:MAG: hypothetical protein QOG03_1321, partial [Actinomycetota bacterium]|nr:hypothetical protein [Actinomycetota bacterium]